MHTVPAAHLGTGSSICKSLILCERQWKEMALVQKDTRWNHRINMQYRPSCAWQRSVLFAVGFPDIKNAEGKLCAPSRITPGLTSALWNIKAYMCQASA